MNIFYLDKSPILAAQMQHDKHVVKMILESAQLLCTAHRILSTDVPDVFYKVTHQNHPSAVWARQSVNNYNWLRAHFEALSDEYTHRYGRVHQSWSKLGKLLLQPPAMIDDSDFTPPTLAMPDEYKQDDAVQAYRSYYRATKVFGATWRRRGKPNWLL